MCGSLLCDLPVVWHLVLFWQTQKKNEATYGDVRNGPVQGRVQLEERFDGEHASKGYILHCSFPSKLATKKEKVFILGPHIILNHCLFLEYTSTGGAERRNTRQGFRLGERLHPHKRLPSVLPSARSVASVM